MTSEIGHDGEHDEHARRQQRAHVRDLERLDEVAPLRVGRPGQAARQRPDGCSAVVKMLRNGRIGDRHQRQQQRPAGVELAAATLIAALPRVRRWIGRMTSRTRTMRTTAERGGEADLALEEGEDVDLDARDRGRVARSAARRDVDDVEGGEGGDHRDGEADADLVAQARQRDRPELLEPARAVDPRRLVQRRVDLGHAGQQQDGAEAEQHPDPDDARRPAARCRSRRARLG